MRPVVVDGASAVIKWEKWRGIDPGVRAEADVVTDAEEEASVPVDQDDDQDHNLEIMIDTTSI